MHSEDHLSRALAFLRVSVFLLMFMWTIDKFINPTHAAGVYAKFYFLGGFGTTMMYLIGFIELVLIVGFVLGVRKSLTYGAVLILHGISTLSAFRQYVAPFDGPNLLFFAAWPALAACYALYVLRDHDTQWVVHS
jgi:putative oxidoreductase